MAKFIVVQLLPEKPVNSEVFVTYLDGLKLTAFDRTKGKPTLGVQIGDSETGASKIKQHKVGADLQSVGTAVIVLEDTFQDEHGGADVLFKIERGGTPINNDQVYYNVPVVDGAIPSDGATAQWRALEPSVYISLPSPGNEASAGSGENISSSGGANENVPAYAGLKSEILKIGGITNAVLKSGLSAEQCLHIASEMSWDRTAHPLPRPKLPGSTEIHEIYTLKRDGGGNDIPESNPNKKIREAFEQELKKFYPAVDMQARQKGQYVYALACASWCADNTAKEKEPGFVFPIQQLSQPGFINQGKVILDTTGAADANAVKFSVPAEYFYALGANLSVGIEHKQRYQIAHSETIARIEEILTVAVADKVVSEKPINVFQAARRLHAIGIRDEPGLPTCKLATYTLVDKLVVEWLKAKSLSDLDLAWTKNAETKKGHLELVMHEFSLGHDNLVKKVCTTDAIPDVSTLITKTEDYWRKVFLPPPEANVDFLPDFTQPGTTKSRTSTFLRRLRKYFELKAGTAPSHTPDDLPAPTGFPPPPTIADTAFSKTDLLWTLLTTGSPPPVTNMNVAFSAMEALWANGLETKEKIKEFNSTIDFSKALIGTVAHEFADKIFKAAGGKVEKRPGSTGFAPINDGGKLVNCLVAQHESKLGEFGFRDDMLDEKIEATTIKDDLEKRVGDLKIASTHENLTVQIPVLDFVNERLEYVVAEEKTDLTALKLDTGVVTGTKCVRLAIPEHSSPAVPTKNFGVPPAPPAPTEQEELAYEKLRKEFATPSMPYDQPLDINRSYLKALGTNRFDTLRHFRKEISEFVLEPDKQPNRFPTHQWRYPVRLNVAAEYLKLSNEELEFFQGKSPATLAEAGRLYGFDATEVDWHQTAVKLPEFLERMEIGYKDFKDLSKSKILDDKEIELADGKTLLDRPPCDLGLYVMKFTDETATKLALFKLTVLVRLWRKLNSIGKDADFSQLKRIVDALELFQQGKINNQFIRQLIALLMLRERFGFGAEGITWFGQAAVAPAEEEIKSFLLEPIQSYLTCYCACQERPRLIKLLAENLKDKEDGSLGIGTLSGFETGLEWYQKPTHVLRLAEAISKVYASDFGVEDLLFLFTNDEHAFGSDPFPLQTKQEANRRPFDLPDDEAEFSLDELRKKLLDVEHCENDAENWTLEEMRLALVDEFGMVTGASEWTELVQHFFPVLAGVSDDQTKYKWTEDVVTQSAEMWNTPADGPFQCAPNRNKLSCKLPLTDARVVEKLAEVKQLSEPEQKAVQNLYFAPRATLAKFAFLFGDFSSTACMLMSEPDETKRLEIFQSEFSVFYRRCQVIASFASDHVGGCRHELPDVTKVLFKSLWADESERKKEFEYSSGVLPALLGLVGSGAKLTIDFKDQESKDRQWQDVVSQAGTFGGTRNASGCPVPTVVPVMEKPQKPSSVFIRNGLVVDNGTAELIGGSTPFTATWETEMLVEQEGGYKFRIRGPEGNDAENDKWDQFKETHDWFVQLKRGQQEWVVSENGNHGRTHEGCVESLPLKRGVYRLSVELTRRTITSQNDCSLATGLELKYCGPDTCNSWADVSASRQFVPFKNGPLKSDAPLDANGTARAYLKNRYFSTVRDVRRTYQRLYKALLFCHRFGLSGKPSSDSGRSEIEYLMSKKAAVEGAAYPKGDTPREKKTTRFDFNELWVRDNYEPIRDESCPKTVSQAWFDIWERIYDYTQLRSQVASCKQRVAWHLFHEAGENHPDTARHLLEFLGVETELAPKVTEYFTSKKEAKALSATDLVNEVWGIRVWRAYCWITDLLAPVSKPHLESLLPAWWSDVEPSKHLLGETKSGNEQLTNFAKESWTSADREDCYKRLQGLNDNLRGRARDALVDYILQKGLIKFGGKPADTLARLNEFFLMDLMVPSCEAKSRLSIVLGIIQTYVQRARLGLENSMLSAEFRGRWDSRFNSYQTWFAQQSRDEHFSENGIEFSEWQTASKSLGFQLLESDLRSRKLSVPARGGATNWKDWVSPDLPLHATLTRSQFAEPMVLAPVDSGGLEILARPDRKGTYSRLAQQPKKREETIDGDGPVSRTSPELPIWMQAAIGQGTEFIRVAAADPPAAIASSAPEKVYQSDAFRPRIAEYFFWIETSSFFGNEKSNQAGPEQDADLDGWHEQSKIPRLTSWNASTMVHLHWSKIENGKFLPPRKSTLGVPLKSGETATLSFAGRMRDSLQFAIGEGQNWDGNNAPRKPGFRYDIATDQSVDLPQVAKATASVSAFPLSLPAFPYFAWYEPGEPLVPTSDFSPIVVIARHLMSHGNYEDALNWLRKFYDPLTENNYKTVTKKQTKKIAALLLYLEWSLAWANSLASECTAGSLEKAKLILNANSKIVGSSPADGYKGNKSTKAISLLNPRLVQIYGDLENAVMNLQFCQEQCAPQGNTDCQSTSLGSPYRFQVILQKATEFAGDVRSLGGALLSAYEKGDTEILSSIRATHERQILDQSLSVRQNQWRESDWQVQALQKTKEIAETRLKYYKQLLRKDLIAKEKSYELFMYLGFGASIAARIAESQVQVASMVPNKWIIAATPVPGFTEQAPVGSESPPSKVPQTIARISESLSSFFNMKASLDLTKAGWERRRQEWRHQVDVLTIEIEQIERQILAAERRRDIALRELNNHQQQMENSAEVHDFLRDKFTNHALYLWLQQETAALYYQSYELAMDCARQAQRAFNLERGYTNRKFIQHDNWDNLHEGLLAGERLQLSLRQMEKAYYDENEREYELSKSFSLRHHFPEAFFQLVHCGACEIEIPEWLFDLDYPGHYMRRIKNVTLTLPCVVGPHQGVHCRLTLLSSTTRVSPQVIDPASGCCDAKANGYSHLPDDPRVVNQYAATDAIATSSGQNDSGMFELRFNDERYLPFEFHGAVSRWRIELPKENNHFDTATLSDAILQMNFMAREGGSTLAEAARDSAKGQTPNGGLLLLNVKRDFPDAWHRFANGCDSSLELDLTASLFPYSFRSNELEIAGMEMLVESEAKSLVWTVDLESSDKCAHKGRPNNCDQMVLQCISATEQCDFLYGIRDDLSWKVGSTTTGNQRLLLKLRSNDDCCDTKHTQNCEQVYLILQYAIKKNGSEPGDQGCC